MLQEFAGSCVGSCVEGINGCWMGAGSCCGSCGVSVARLVKLSRSCVVVLMLVW